MATRGPSNAPRDVLYKARVLPLVLADEYFNAVNIIEEYVLPLVHEYPGVVNFFHYLRYWWRHLADILSVLCEANRTNNILEGFNRQLLEIIGGAHPNVWEWLGIYLLTIHLR